MNKEQTMLSAEKKRTRRMLMVMVPATIIMVALAIAAGIYANKLENEKKVAVADGYINKATADDFVAAASNSGYVCTNVKKEMPKMVKSAIIATKNDENSITYLEFKNEDNAKSYTAETAKEYIAVTEKTGVTDAKRHREENYEYYIASADGKYMHVVRLKNTIICASVPEENRQDVEKVINDLNY